MGDGDSSAIRGNHLIHASRRNIDITAIIMGAIIGATQVVTEEALKEDVLDRIPVGTEEMNLKALNAGLKAGKE